MPIVQCDTYKNKFKRRIFAMVWIVRTFFVLAAAAALNICVLYICQCSRYSWRFYFLLSCGCQPKLFVIDTGIRVHSYSSSPFHWNLSKILNVTESTIERNQCSSMIRYIQFISPHSSLFTHCDQLTYGIGPVFVACRRTQTSYNSDMRSARHTTKKTKPTKKTNKYNKSDRRTSLTIALISSCNVNGSAAH